MHVELITRAGHYDAELKTRNGAAKKKQSLKHSSAFQDAAFHLNSAWERVGYNSTWAMVASSAAWGISKTFA